MPYDSHDSILYDDEPVLWDDEQETSDPRWLIRPHIDLCDDCTGETVGDNLGHLTARTALLNLLHEDSRVHSLFASWSEKTGLDSQSELLISQSDNLAALLGLADRGQFWSPDHPVPDTLTVTVQVEDGVDEEAETARLEQLPVTLRKSVDSWVATWSRIPVLVMPEAVHFVRDELGLRWPWLAIELVEMYLWQMHGEVCGLQNRFEVSWEPVDPPAPRVSVRFATQPGETVSEAFGRLVDEFLSAEDELMAAAAATDLPQGRATDEATVTRQVDWFYRNRLHDESLNHIAAADLYDRATVRHGIRQAERRLGLTPYEFKPRGK